MAGKKSERKATVAHKFKKTKTFKRKAAPRAGITQSKDQTKTQNQKGYLPFGVRYNTRLPYVENFAIGASGTGGLTTITNTFRSNSMFDPRFQLGGHQPLQYAGMLAAYERVWIWGCKVELTFSNPSHDGMWVGYRVRGDTNPVTTSGKTLSYVQEMRESNIRPLNNTGKQATTFKFFVNNPKLFGITKQQYSDLTYSHKTDENPALDMLIEPFASHSVFEESATVRCNIKIIYYGQFTNPKSSAQSGI